MSLFDDILPQNKSNPPAGGNPPVQNDPLAPAPQIIITESVPMNILAPMGENPPIEDTPDTPVPVAQIPVDSSGILIIDGTNTVSAVAPMAPTLQIPISPIAEVSVPIIAMQEVIQVPDITSTSLPPSSLFSLVSDTPISEVPTISNISDLDSSVVKWETASPAFQTTEDLIAHEISDHDEFILSLDVVDRAKLEQEAEYKKQKEHFAELEIQAESEHQKVLTERSHAEKMKAYLEEEVKWSHTEKIVTKKSSK